MQHGRAVSERRLELGLECIIGFTSTYNISHIGPDVSSVSL